MTGREGEMGGGQMLKINGSRRNNNGATHLHAQRTTQQLTQKILNERGLTHKEGSQRVCVCVWKGSDRALAGDEVLD